MGIGWFQPLFGSQCFFNFLSKQAVLFPQPGLALTENSRTTDFQQGLFVIIWDEYDEL